MKKQLLQIFAVVCTCFFPVFSYAAPAITISASAVDILGSSQKISITATLIDPNSTGMLRVSGTGIIPLVTASTTTPATTATVGPIYGNDVIIDGLGNLNGTYYLVQVFTVNSAGVIASTPSLQNYYAFTGSGTVDLATATPLAPSFMTGTNGAVTVPGTLTATIFDSASSFIATAGFERLANTDLIEWRNNANNGNVTLGVSSGDRLQFGGVNIPTVSSTDTITNKTLTSPTITGVVLGLFWLTCNGTASAGTTLFLGHDACTSGNGIQVPAPAGTWQNLRCKAQTGGVNASSGVVTLRKNGSSSGATCTFGTGTTCSDTTHSFTTAAGDLLDIQFTTQAAETLATIACSIENKN